ncbi:alpha/beta hydrolase [Alicyclobacillus ferrooxydans]|uniref:alpha/beta hydrolase n=1 Tax=Alicyclobacillus ferrooxydans TaxID=471514 RepID=UPI0006D558ED|nr:alpha/beta hydrolase-fold protein [Alicyclobacillus ferrooxydans]
MTTTDGNLSDPQYTRRVIETHTLQSAHLGEDRTLKIYLPPGYTEHPEARYPVVYCHDGLEFFTHGRIATICNKLILEGKLNPLFIVGIEVHKQTRNDDYGPDGARHDAYTAFVAKECVPFVEGRYRVSDDPYHRFMAGISLGAAASLSLHLRYPELFRRLLLFSGAFYDTSRELVRRESFLNDLTAYMVVGRQETGVDTTAGPYDFYQANQTMRDLLRARSADVTYKESDGTHIWGFWQKEIPDALEFLQRTLA